MIPLVIKYPTQTFAIFLLGLVIAFSISLTWFCNILGETNAYDRQKKKKKKKKKEQEEEDRKIQRKILERLEANKNI